VKILLDECIDWRLKDAFADSSVSTVQDEGWLGRKNGDLLRSAAAAGFQVFVTIDKNIRFQQNLSEFPLIIVVLSSVRSTLRDLKPLVPKAQALLRTATSGSILTIE